MLSFIFSQILTDNILKQGAIILSIFGIGSKLKDEDEKKDFMYVLSKIDIKIDTKPIIEGNEICYNIWILKRNTKRRKHFQLCKLEFGKREKMEMAIPNLIDILNGLRRCLDLPDEFRECYEVLPKESAN